MSSTPAFRTILIPTDFSDHSMVAFAHALRLAVALGAELDILHVEANNDQQDWHWGPHVRDTLTRWGYLQPGATDADLARLGVRVRKTVAGGVEAGQAIVDEVSRSHADLVVMATHGRSGIEAWLQPSVTAPVAAKGQVPVLVIPHSHRGFVELETGRPSLNRILVPVDLRPHPAPAFDAAALLALALPSPDLTFATLHVGPGTVETDWIEMQPNWNLLHWSADDGVVVSIKETARTWEADLTVCVTEGRRGVLDMLRGSTVERLLRDPPGPILVVPNEWGTNEVGTS
jgi:nucleotide-binding universal stress UspA family protein